MIIDRDNVLIAHGVDPTQWAQRWGIEPMEGVKCQACGADLKLDTCFYTQHLRGLMAEQCGCGEGFRAYCVVPAPGSGDLFDAIPKQAAVDAATRKRRKRSRKGKKE